MVLDVFRVPYDFEYGRRNEALLRTLHRGLLSKIAIWMVPYVNPGIGAGMGTFIIGIVSRDNHPMDQCSSLKMTPVCPVDRPPKMFN